MGAETKKTEKKKTKVNLGFVLDETGSMDVVRGSTISAFNEYVNSLKNDENATYRFTLVKFKLDIEVSEEFGEEHVIEFIYK